MFITDTTSDATTSRITTSGSDVPTRSRTTTEVHIAEGVLMLFHSLSVCVDTHL